MALPSGAIFFFMASASIFDSRGVLVVDSRLAALSGAS